MSITSVGKNGENISATLCRHVASKSKWYSPPLKSKGAGGFEEFSGKGIVKGFRADSENSTNPLTTVRF